MMKTASLLTLGCRVNQYETRCIADKLKENGFEIVKFGAECDVCIINTCTVTGESARKSRQMIHKARKASPGAYIIVTGCFAQSAESEALLLGAADAVIGNSSKLDAVSAALAHTSGYVDIKPFGGYEDMSTADSERLRAFMKIEDGCSGKCSYCIIPSVRGPVRSREPASVISEAKLLAEKGCRELILSGIETSAYEFGLVDLIKNISAIEGIERIRLGSLDPSFIKEDFCASLSRIPEYMPHFHLSIQSGSSSVLKRMRRKYNASQAMKSIELLKKYFPGLQLTADVITGFPGETDEEFLETVGFVRQAGFFHVHIFKYSERPGTEAADMPDKISEEVKTKRSKILSAAVDEIKSDIFKNLISSGRELEVLYERYRNGHTDGHSREFFEVRANGKAADKIFRVRPESFENGYITGTVIR